MNHGVKESRRGEEKEAETDIMMMIVGRTCSVNPDLVGRLLDPLSLPKRL